MNLTFSICSRAIADELGKYHQESLLTDARICGIEDGLINLKEPYLDSLWNDIEKCGKVDMR